MRNMLTSVFGISIKYEAWNHQDSLPVYIAGRNEELPFRATI
jgi:hypothetical protein